MQVFRSGGQTGQVGPAGQGQDGTLIIKVVTACRVEMCSFTECSVSWETQTKMISWNCLVLGKDGVGYFMTLGQGTLEAIFDFHLLQLKTR